MQSEKSPKQSRFVAQGIARDLHSSSCGRYRSPEEVSLKVGVELGGRFQEASSEQKNWLTSRFEAPTL